MTAIIHSLLPSKEGYSTAQHGAVALCVKDSFTGSAYAEKATIFGRGITGTPLGGATYQPVAPRLTWLFGGNIGHAKGYLAAIKGQVKPDLIEVHGRCQVARLVAASRPDIKVALYLHNDPRGMKGARTPQERRWLLDHLAGVFCVSNYLKECFLEGLNATPQEAAKVRFIPIGVDRVLQHLPAKDRSIVLVGRMVPEKGMLEAATALARVLPSYPDWTVSFVGARRFEESQPSAYEQAVADALAPIRDQAVMTGFISAEEKQHLQDRAAIVLVPSQWQEPAGRVVLEALATGSALITSRRGGIPEYAEGRSMVLDPPDEDALAAQLEQLLGQPNVLKRWQEIAWQDYPFDVANMVSCLDAGRRSILST